jgi:hypothetical protein
MINHRLRIKGIAAALKRSCEVRRGKLTRPAKIC